MKTKNKKQKRSYTKPQITEIKVDNEISLVMMSKGPGEDPPETSLDRFSINPFKFPRL